MVTIEQLKAFGVNTEEGLARCLNQEAFYLNMVKKSLATDNFDKLKAALDANDLDAAFELAHGLKGMVGNLSLTPLYEPISEMTENLRARKEMDYKPYIDTVMEKKAALDKLCAG